MRNLHPDLVAAVQQQALYSTAEEELLGTFASVCVCYYHFTICTKLSIIQTHEQCTKL